MKVSVVIPIYNVEKYVNKCLESIVNQTLSDIEIICVDDCGLDNSMSIVERYAKSDERITIIHNLCNKGLSTSRNVGLKSAKGKYIYFLDSDDYLEKNALELLFDIAEKNMVDIVYFDTDVVTLDHYENGCNGYEPPQYSNNYQVQNGQDLFSNAIKNNTWDTCVWRQFYSTDFLKKNNICFADGLAHEDWSFSFETAMLAKRVIYAPLKLHMYIRRENSITDKTSWHRLISLIKIYIIMQSIWDKTDCKEYVHESIFIHMNNLKEYIQQNYKKVPYIDNNINFRDNKLLKYFIPQYYKGYYYYKLPQVQMEKIIKFKRIAIYGAAELGIQLYYLLNDIGIKIETFLVTEKIDSSVIEDVPVNKIQEYDETLKIQGIVLIAVRKSYNVMYENAKKIGFENIMIIHTKKEE